VPTGTIEPIGDLTLLGEAKLLLGGGKLITNLFPVAL
jgi:hypothetical protein